MYYPARRAGFRHLRGAGWSIALPIAAGLGLTAAAVSGHIAAGLVLGSIVSLIGLAVLWLGYSLGDIADAYWMVPLAVASLPVALLTSVVGHGYQWVWAIGWVGAVIILFGIVAGIGRHADSEGGLPHLITCIVRSLIPGCHSRY